MNESKVLLSGVSGFIALCGAYFQQVLPVLLLLVLVMILDYVSGMAKAWVGRELSSRVGIIGVLKKVGYLALVLVCIVIDIELAEFTSRFGLEMGGYHLIAMLVTVWLTLNECISILENLAKIGVPLPGFLIKLVSRLKMGAEEKGQGLEGGGNA